MKNKNIKGSRVSGFATLEKGAYFIETKIDWNKTKFTNEQIEKAFKIFSEIYEDLTNIFQKEMLKIEKGEQNEK